MFNGMYTARSINAEAIKKTYEGFKVSKDAVHIDEDGKYYVYINREGVNRRRDVKILYADDAWQQKIQDQKSLQTDQLREIILRRR